MDKEIKFSKKKVALATMLGIITAGAIVGTMVLVNKKNIKMISE